MAWASWYWARLSTRARQRGIVQVHHCGPGANWRDVRAVPALIAHLPDVLTRLEVVQALGEIGDASAEPVLVERLKSDEYVPVRVAAAHALARMGGARAVLALKWSASNDKEPRVAEAALAGLSELRRGR